MQQAHSHIHHSATAHSPFCSLNFLLDDSNILMLFASQGPLHGGSFATLTYPLKARAVVDL
jgi:hypothetical protein